MPGARRAARLVRGVGVTVLLLAPVGAVAALGAREAQRGPEIVRPVEVTVAIGPHETTVRVRPDFTSMCVELEAPGRTAGWCAPVGEDLVFVGGFGDGEGDAEFAAVGLAPPEATSVRLIPEEGEPVAGELHELDDRDDLLFTAYWSFAAVAPEPPRVEVLDADGTVLLEG